jgi:hypothetical protein
VLVWRAGNLLRIVLAVVEGVVRSTFLHRSSSSSGLARLDGGYGAYIAVLKVRYAPLFATAYTPQAFAHGEAHFPPSPCGAGGAGAATAASAPLPQPARAVELWGEAPSGAV